MWLGKFLDFEDDIKELKSKTKKEIFNSLGKSKLTTLEFTIIENIFNSQLLSGYDLIKNLNQHFAGTWEARSGTIYPILRKLEKDGFLKSKKVRSQIGPLRKIYSLTEPGEEILKYKVNKKLKAKWLKVDDSFLIAGNIQNANHGDRGAHGARGSLRSFAKTGRKTNTAHSHQAGVIDGAWSAGVSGKLDMTYNTGMSAWSHSHIITLPSGKRQIITQHDDGCWCADAWLSRR